MKINRKFVRTCRNCVVEGNTTTLKKRKLNSGLIFLCVLSFDQAKESMWGLGQRPISSKLNNSSS